MKEIPTKSYFDFRYIPNNKKAKLSGSARQARQICQELSYVEGFPTKANFRGSVRQARCFYSKFYNQIAFQ